MKYETSTKVSHECSLVESQMAVACGPSQRNYEKAPRSEELVWILPLDKVDGAFS
jgi:hypothetical protein